MHAEVHPFGERERDDDPFVLILSSFDQVPQFNSDESRLRASLLQNYVPQARPVLNPTTVTLVDIGLSIIQVMSLVSNDLRCFFD